MLVETMRTNNILEKQGQGNLIEVCQMIIGKETQQWERFLEFAPNKATRGTQVKYVKKSKGTNHRAQNL